MTWADGKITKASITSGNGGTLRIASVVPLKCDAEMTLVKDNGIIDNPLLVPQEIRRPLIAPNAPINTGNTNIPEYIYDINTTPGSTYTFSPQ